MKTEGIKILVQDVLAMFPKPYGEDIILEVFIAIEKKSQIARALPQPKQRCKRRPVRLCDNQPVDWKICQKRNGLEQPARSFSRK